MSRTGKTRRRKLLVDFGVQGHLLRHVLFQWGGFLLATAFILVIIEMLAGNPSGDLSRVQRQHFPVLLAVAILAPLFVIDLVKFSHRFVGPIVRLRREMKDLADGKLNPPLKFREGDYWKDLAKDFNRISEKLRAGTQLELDNLQSDVSFQTEDSKCLEEAGCQS